MPEITLPIASHYTTGSILTLVLPLAVVIVIVAWYLLLLRRGAGER